MVSALLVTCCLTLAPPAWPDSLYVSWGPHDRRIAIAVRNDGDAPLEGVPVTLGVGTGPNELPLAGYETSALRATEWNGRELLWAVTGSTGLRKVRGPLAVGDRVTLPAACPARESRFLYLYYDNPSAWPAPEMLPVGLANTAFEEGGPAGPSGWTARATDGAHRMDWAPEEGRGGSGCARCTVEPGAAPAWVKVDQEGIPVTPGARYRVSAWVKAEGCTGSVGWFLHVGGAQPQLINRVENAGEGTYDWREIAFEFTAPAGATHATVGTVLYGVGTAWYDDLSFESLDAAGAVIVTVGPEERLEAERLGAPDPATGWYVTLPVLSDAASEVLVLADTRPAELAWMREHRDWSTPVRADLRIPGSPEPTASFPALGSGLTLARLPGNTVLTCPVSLRPARETPDLARDARLLAEQNANLLEGAGFESDADLAAWGGASAEGGAEGARARRDERPGAGHCLRLDVPREVAPAWVGVRQGPVPIRPGASYYLGALLKTGPLGGVVRVHAHIHDAAGKVLTYLSTSQGIGAEQDWTWLSTSFRAPAEAVDVQVHLTMDTWGTVWYDDIALLEVVRALPPARADKAPEALEVAAVDAVVKVFPSDRVAPSAEPPRLSLCRNEYEPLQLAVRLPAGLRSATVRVDPPRSDAAALPAPSLARVACVPVDAPTSYYRSEAPAYCRRIPEGSGSSDGWPGWWPDPLVPVAEGSVEFPEGRTSALWLTFQAPAQALPGEYRTTVSVAAGGQEARVPVVLTVRDFTLPAESRLRAVLDLRDGSYPHGAFGAGDRDAAREAWYRFLAAHRVTPDVPGPDPSFTMVDGTVTMDAADFDRWATLCLDELRMNHLYTPWFFYALGWAYRPPERFGFAPFTPEYDKALGAAYRLYLDHLTARGWREKLIHYVSDEPFFDSKEQVAQDLRDYCALFAGIAPDVPRFSSTWRPAPPLEGAITLWGAGHYGVFPVEKMRERQAAGDRVLFTTDGQMCIDTPYCAVERLLPYYADRYGALGYEFWGVSWWTYDPWEWGWHSFISQSDEGAETYWIRYPNGDGYLAYPGAPFGVNGPLSSIRLEQAREGQEDAECLHALRTALAALGDRADAIPDAKAALAEAESLVAIPNAGGLRSSQMLPDPSRVAAVHERVGAALEACERARREAPR